MSPARASATSSVTDDGLYWVTVRNDVTVQTNNCAIPSPLFHVAMLPDAVDRRFAPDSADIELERTNVVERGVGEHVHGRAVRPRAERSSINLRSGLSDDDEVVDRGLDGDRLVA